MRGHSAQNAKQMLAAVSDARSQKCAPKGWITAGPNTLQKLHRVPPFDKPSTPSYVKSPKISTEYPIDQPSAAPAFDSASMTELNILETTGNCQYPWILHHIHSASPPALLI
uniref:Gag protein n=1 Tax=Panagrellus redivivus TaxID=6233 RepID=A0A7E4V3T4_PANRE